MGTLTEFLRKGIGPVSLQILFNPASRPAEARNAASQAAGLPDAGDFAALLESAKDSDAAAAAAATGSAAGKKRGDGLDDLVDALKKLGDALQSDQPLDPSLLNQLNASVTALAQKLDIDLSQVAGGIASSGAGEAGSLLDKLSQKIGDVAGQLQPLAGDLADKLKALAQNLTPAKLGADKLAQLGFDSELHMADADLQGAIENLVRAQPKPTEPVLARPSLDVAATTVDKHAPAKPAEGARAPNRPVIDTKGQAGKAEPGKLEARPHADKTSAKAHADDALIDAAKASGDETAQPIGPVAPAAQRPDAAAGVRPLPTAYTSAQTQLNVPGIAFEIARQATAGASRFEIRLDPPELGRIDVKLDLDKAGNVSAKLVVEKTETLDMLMRDQRALERALQQAGLDGARTNLEFSLRQNNSARQDQQGNGNPQFAGRSGGDGGQDEASAVAPIIIHRGYASASGVNILA